MSISFALSNMCQNFAAELSATRSQIRATEKPIFYKDY